MATRPRPLGDAHNFGRRVSQHGARIRKPRALLWEWLLLDGNSPLRRLLDEAAPGTFSFLPDLSFAFEGLGGEVERLSLRPLPAPSGTLRRTLAVVVGRSLALWSWLGVADLHWENLA